MTDEPKTAVDYAAIAALYAGELIGLLHSLSGGPRYATLSGLHAYLVTEIGRDTGWTDSGCALRECSQSDQRLATFAGGQTGHSPPDGQRMNALPQHSRVPSSPKLYGSGRPIGLPA